MQWYHHPAFICMQETILIDYGDGTYDWIFKGEDGDERLEVLNTLDNLTHKEIVADMKKQKFPVIWVL